MRAHRGLHALEAALEEAPTDVHFHPRPWQATVLTLVSSPADDRSVIWVYDPEGKAGKSRLAYHLCCQHSAVILEGKLADMCYAYNKEPIAVFDISRAAADHSDHLYSMAEKLKNGFFLSTKYESRTKYFKPPHVVFFANKKPDEGKWSKDRVKLIDLSTPIAQAVNRERSRSPPANLGDPVF